MNKAIIACVWLGCSGAVSGLDGVDMPDAARASGSAAQCGKMDDLCEYDGDEGPNPHCCPPLMCHSTGDIYFVLQCGPHYKCGKRGEVCGYNQQPCCDEFDE